MKERNGLERKETLKEGMTLDSRKQQKYERRKHGINGERTKGKEGKKYR